MATYVLLNDVYLNTPNGMLQFRAGRIVDEDSFQFPISRLTAVGARLVLSSDADTAALAEIVRWYRMRGMDPMVDLRPVWNPGGGAVFAPIAPVIFQVSPDNGPTTGGTQITIEGGGFEAPTSIEIGGIPCTDVVLLSSTALQCITGGPHATGIVAVAITTPRGSVSANAFTYETPVPSPELATFACPGSLAVGEFVYLTGIDAVNRANASNVGTAPAIGVVVDKPFPTSAVVQTEGEASIFSGLTVGATYYLSTVDGQATTTPPSAFGQVAQKLGIAVDATTMLLMIDRDFVVL